MYIYIYIYIYIHIYRCIYTNMIKINTKKSFQCSVHENTTLSQYILTLK